MPLLHPDSRKLASHIDHTLLRADAGAGDVERLCAEAREYGFCGVCIGGSWVSFAGELLSGAGTRIVSVAGFPLGHASVNAKCFEVATALKDGASEVDVVLNVGRLKQGDDRYVERELEELVRASEGHVLKVIIETCLLTREEKVRACRLVAGSGAAFVKTSTGFSSGGATVEDVALLRSCLVAGVGVKASGGIRDTKTALEMILAGAGRLGTSASVEIMAGAALTNVVKGSTNHSG